MEQFFEFVANHWPLWLALVIIIALIIRMETQGTVAGVNRVSPQQAVSLINHQQAMVIDIRENQLYKKGHIIGAKNINMVDLEQQLKKLKKFQNKPIILNCVDGTQAPKAGSILLKNQFTNVFFLQGGITAWQNASLPLEKE